MLTVVLQSQKRKTSLASFAQGTQVTTRDKPGDSNTQTFQPTHFRREAPLLATLAKVTATHFGCHAFLSDEQDDKYVQAHQSRSEDAKSFGSFVHAARHVPLLGASRQSHCHTLAFKQGTADFDQAH
jgi:hypothetical protein